MSRCIAYGMTQQERARTLALCADRLTFAEVGSELGITASAVVMRLKRWGVHDRGLRKVGRKRKPVYPFVMARARGLLLSQIAEAYGISDVAVVNRMSKAGIPKTFGFFNRMSEEQRAVYRAALDDDRLDHADALELALEYCRGAA